MIPILRACIASIVLGTSVPLLAASMPLYLNTTSKGAQVTSTVTQFPLLVRLRKGDIDFDSPRYGGSDIRFTKADGTVLPHEIERWDPDMERAEIWVRMDSVRGDFDAQRIDMHWGASETLPGANVESVFDPDIGFLGVWHLGYQGESMRANSVPGGEDARTVRFPGGGTREGRIALADSMVGGESDSYLDLGDAFSEIRSALTFSIWCLPSGSSLDARLLELGNGPENSLALRRSGPGTDLALERWRNDALSGSVAAQGVLENQVWQHLAVVVADSTVRLFRNGVQIASGAFAGIFQADGWQENFLGRSDGSGGSGFRGILDEATISNSARTADWIKLAYENQKGNQSLVVFQEPRTCMERFAAPSDTALAEGARLVLRGIADCAQRITWESVSGPIPKILDPEVKVLDLVLPRITGDTLIRFRFIAEFAGKVESAEVAVRIKEAIPEPRFTLPDRIPWTGMDTLMIKPDIANRAEIQASRDSVISFVWTVKGLDLDSSWGQEALLIRPSQAKGEAEVELCLSNHGQAVCRTTTLKIDPSIHVFRLRRPAQAGKAREFHDPLGRRAWRHPWTPVLSGRPRD